MTGHTATGHTPGERPRVLVIASTGYGYIAPVIRSARQLLDRPEMVLVVRAAPPRHDSGRFARPATATTPAVAALPAAGFIGTEQAVARWWLPRGDVDLTGDPVAYPGAHAAELVGAVVAVRELDPVPYAVLWASLDAGLPVALHYTGAYPHRPGSEAAAPAARRGGSLSAPARQALRSPHRAGRRVQT